MRITWYSNAPWAASGYGQQTADVVPRLIAAGHQVAVAANYGLTGAIIEHDGIPVFPGGYEQYSNDVLPAHHALWRGDWVVTLYDTWTLRTEAFKGLRVASWVPIDHQPVPNSVAAWCRSVFPIAMSRFGQSMLKQQGIDAAYVPHAVNTDIFHPVETLSSGAPARQAMGVPDDAFVVMVNAANNPSTPSRKAFPEMFNALGYFMAQHSDAHAYIHSDPERLMGMDLLALARATSIPLDRIHFADGYNLLTARITQTDLAALYSAADVLLATSMGEGFGIPVIEAQACGTPVIVSDFSAQPELVGGGWTVEGQPYWNQPQGAFLFMPYIGGIVARLEEAYAARGDAEIRQKALTKAAEYDSALVFERYWKPVLAEMEARLASPLVVQPNRAARRRSKKARRAAA